MLSDLTRRWSVASCTALRSLLKTSLTWPVVSINLSTNQPNAFLPNSTMISVFLHSVEISRILKTSLTLQFVPINQRLSYLTRRWSVASCTALRSLLKTSLTWPFVPINLLTKQPNAFLPYSPMIGGFLHSVEISIIDLPHVTSCVGNDLLATEHLLTEPEILHN